MWAIAQACQVSAHQLLVLYWLFKGTWGCTAMRYLAPRCIGSTGPKMADNAGAEMVLPCRKCPPPPLEFAETERLPWTEWPKPEEIKQNRKPFEAIVISDNKDENWTEEDEILVEAIRYVVTCTRGTACRYPTEGSSKNSREKKRYSATMVNYIPKEERFVCKDCSI